MLFAATQYKTSVVQLVIVRSTFHFQFRDKVLSQCKQTAKSRLRTKHNLEGNILALHITHRFANLTDSFSFFTDEHVHVFAYYICIDLQNGDLTIVSTRLLSIQRDGNVQLLVKLL